jgi:hypothetical protein
MEEHFDITPAEPALKEVIEPEERTLEGTALPPDPYLNDEPEEVGESDEDHLDELLPQKPPKLTNDEVFAPKIMPVKKERKKRKPMTQEQLDKLAEARTKAFAVKAQKRKEREELETLKKKVETKKQELVKEEILMSLDEDEIPESMKQARKYKEKKLTQQYQQQLSPEQIAQAVAQGVESYDRKRKAEKKVKKERQAEETRQNEMKQKIQRAIDPNAIWDQFLI